MVTAILPSLTDDSSAASNSRAKPQHNQRHSIALSIESQLTITPERFARSLSEDEGPRLGDYESDYEQETGVHPHKKPQNKSSALAGFVGLFTGCGALVALTLFLPLPAHFGGIKGVTPAQAVADSFYVVACVAVFVSTLR